MIEVPSEWRQLDSPYFSTLRMVELISDQISKFPMTRNVVDLGCGIGAQTIHFANQFRELRFTGLDYNESRISVANDLVIRKQLSNLTFLSQDISKLSGGDSRVDGVLSIHTLCCFKEIETFFQGILSIRPEWMIVNSLFWDGPLDVLIHIRDHTNLAPDEYVDSDFNIFSKDRVSEYLSKAGYKTKFLPFYPPESLPVPQHGARGTYTIKTDWDEHTQFSGPVHLPWNFLISELL